VSERLSAVDGRLSLGSAEPSPDGRTIAEIAAQLYLSEGTVRNYLSACIQKTGPGTAPRRCASPPSAAGSRP
jgi:hypothetical protein